MTRFGWVLAGAGALLLLLRHFDELACQVQAMEDRLMSQIDDLKARISAVQQSEADVKQRVADATAGLQSTIDALRAHEAAADLTDEIAALEALNTDMQGIAPAPSP